MELRYVTMIFGVRKLQFRVFGDQWGPWQDVPSIMEQDLIEE